MLERLKKLLEPEQQPQPDDGRDRLKIATCVVLLEVARIDEEFTDDEKQRILDILRERYSLSDDDARELLEASTRSRDESVDLWHFTNQINQLCSNDDKIQIVEEVWRVVVADGGIHGHESHFMRQLASLLNLTHPQLIDAKVKILGEVTGENG